MVEMLDFLKVYLEKREKVEEEKLKIVKEMKEEKKNFLISFLSIWRISYENGFMI